MSEGTALPGRRPGSRGLLAAAGVLALAAVALPGASITGAIEPGDPRKLVLGSWLLRGALLAAAALLALAPRFEREGAPAPRREEDPGRAGPWIAAIVGLAAALRVHRLGSPLWFDEIWMLVGSVRPPIAETLRTFETDNNHPLYSFLAALCVRVLGESAWALRLPAAVFGIASVAATYAFARRLLGSRTALTAAALLAFLWIHVDFSQNARAYTGLLLFTVTGSHALVVALETGSRRAWIAHGVSLALCVMLHLTGVFAAVGHVAVIAWYAVRGRASLAPGGLRAGVLGLVLGTLLAFAAYALVLPQVVHFFLLRPERVAIDAAWTDPLWFVEEAARQFGIGWVPPGALIAAGALAAIGLAIVAWRRAPSLLLLFAVPAATVAAAMLGLGRNLWPRLFFFLAGFGVLVALEGFFALTRLASRRLGERAAARVQAAAVALMLAVCALTLPRAYALPKQDFGAAKDWIDSVRRPDEPVVSVGMASFIYREYYGVGWADAKTPEDLALAIPPGRSGYVVFTFPVYVQSRLPEVWKVIEARGREVNRFRAGIGDGDLVVLRLDG